MQTGTTVVHVYLDIFENGAFFLRIWLPSTCKWCFGIKPKLELFENGLQTVNFLTMYFLGVCGQKKMEVFENNDVKCCGQVNRERKICHPKYYKAKINHLRTCKLSIWWKEIRKISGMTPASTTCDMPKSLCHIADGPDASTSDLANTTGQAFLSSMNSFSSLPPDFSVNPITCSNCTNPAPELVVSTHSVIKKLSMLNSSKVQGPDGIPAWLLKENADLFAEPERDILNYSYREGHLPRLWKEADIIPVPKQKPIKDINKHLQPILVTPIISKVAEEYVVESHVKPAVLKRIDSNQFGSIPNSSTTHALISMLHTWNKHTDGNGLTVRVVMFDFKKAFDLIEHRILAEKLLQYEIPTGILHWIIDFLTNRKQRVKLAQDCHSEWGSLAASVPQGTKLGPWLFLVIINDLDVEDLDLWKFVDDMTMAESTDKSKPSKIQASIDELASKSQVDRFQLNEAKCKELRISFAKTKHDFEPITINRTH